VLERLAGCEHPYYCSDSNFYSNEPRQRYETATEFLDDFEDADIDMNLVFRWDVKPRGESGADMGRYCAEVFMMLQRKGIFKPIYIAHINEPEAERFEKYLAEHYETLKEIWAPFGV
jgi:hypothetical protein